MAVSQPLPDYKGYLRPWVSEIARLHHDGMPPAAIASMIRDKVRAYYSSNADPYGRRAIDIEPEPMVRVLIKQIDGKPVRVLPRKPRPSIFGPPRHSLDRLPRYYRYSHFPVSLEVQTRIIELYRSGLSAVQISRKLQSTRKVQTSRQLDWEQPISARDAAEHLEYIRKIVRSWAFRVVALAHEQGILQRMMMPVRERPLDMGGPRDEWIERDPWSEQ